MCSHVHDIAEKFHLVLNNNHSIIRLHYGSCSIELGVRI